jgi:hypothetical protein
MCQSGATYLDDNDVHFVLDLYSAGSLKQQFVGRYVAPLWHIIQVTFRQYC